MRYTTVDDVGVAINPMLVTGQVHGGVAQGIGQALYEGVAYDAEGQLLTASYQDYCIPRADDIPPIEVTLDGSAPCRTNPLGAKGCGESGAIGGPPCITNGVMDALSELGIKSITTPLSPLKVWQAIQEAKAARGVSLEVVIPGSAVRPRPGISCHNFEIPGSRLTQRPGMTVFPVTSFCYPAAQA